MQPHDSTTLEKLDKQAKAGLIPWSRVQAHQNSLMPRCANHPNRPAPAIQDGTPICVDCFAAIVAARQEQRS